MKNAKLFQPDTLSAQYRCERCWTSNDINLYPKSQFLDDDTSGFVILCARCRSEAPIEVSRKVFEDLFLRFTSTKELIIHYKTDSEEEAKKLWCKEHKIESADYETGDFQSHAEIVEMDEDEEFEEEEIHAPFGYVLNDNTLAINPDKAEKVKIIYQKYLDGNTMERIARSLKGEASPGTLTVREILKDPVYAGYIFKGQDVIKGPHEPIIHRKTFNSVQMKIVRNIRNPKYVYKPLQLQG